MKSNNNQGVKRFYVYGHYTLESKLFYIGVGKILNTKTLKLKSKYSRAYHFCNRTRFWRNICNKNGVVVKILNEYSTREDALKEEKRLISFYGKRLKGGILCNLSDGGEQGPIGRTFKMSDAQKKLISDARSFTFYVYSSEGEFLKEIKTIKNVAEFCGVTYNAIHSCMKTKNFSKNFFIYKDFKGSKLTYTKEDLNFSSSLCRKVITINTKTEETREHESIASCARDLKVYRTTIQDALKKGFCTNYKIFLKDNQQPSL